QDLGMSMPKSVIEVSESGDFSGEVSAEQIDQFDDVKIIVTYGGQELIDALKADPLLSKMPAVASDSIVALGNDPLGTAANPTPLALPWVLNDYVKLLAEAADKSE
ncbi:MAG TPA: iron-siderophore ABC transporter substrate-binding protein, partial [Devosia sp.]|nr:iron-siderophore ABC transporter substrate-binding protein [Devosia sp.]